MQIVAALRKRQSLKIEKARIQSIPSTQQLHRQKGLIEHTKTSSKIYSLCASLLTIIDSESRATLVSTSR